MCPDDRAEVGVVALDGRSTGFDESLEGVFGIVAAHRILAHFKAQEVKPRFAALWQEGMGNTGLRGMKRQPELLEPRCH